MIGRSTFDLQPVFETLADSAVRLCAAERAIIHRFDGRLLKPAVIHNPTAELRELAERTNIEPGRGSASGRAILERRTIHIHDVQTDPEYTFPAARLAEPIRTVLAIPMLRADEPLGVIFIYRHEVRPFSDSQITLMETFADQAAIAIENARLLTELQSKNANLTEALEQQTATAEILRVISSSPTDIQPVLDTVAESAARLCEASDAAIFRRDGERLYLVAHRGPIPYGNLGEYTIPVVHGTVMGRTMLEARTVHVEDLQIESAEFPEGSEIARQLGHRTTLVVPLMREGAPIGAINVRRTEAQLFTERQVALLQTFADQAVIAIENVRLFTELASRNRELRIALEQQTATSELLKVIGRSTFDLQPVFETLAENAVRLCEAERGFIWRPDGQLLRPVVIHNASPELREFAERNPIVPGRNSGAARAALERRIVHIPDALADPDYTFGARQVDPIRTVLAIPMLRAEELLGVIAIYRLEVRPFTESQIALMETFADQAAIAIENARLLTELQTKNANLTEALEQQTATAEILRVISSSPTDIQPVLDTVAECAARLCESHDASIFRRDGDQLLLVAHHGPIDFGPTGEFSLALVPGMTNGRSVLDARTIHVADLQSEVDEFPEGSATARQFGFRTALNVPLMREGVAIGSISLRRTEAQLFSERQVALLQTFADQAVIAIENVRLFRELEARNRDLTVALEQQTATSEILRVISGSQSDIQPVFDVIAKSAVRLCDGVNSATVRLQDGLIHLVASHNWSAEGLAVSERLFPMPPDRDHLTAHAIRESRIIHIHRMHDDPAVPVTSRDLAVAQGYQTLLVVPMLREGQAVGAIVVAKAEGPFSESQVELLKTFADQAAIAIENARLLTELQSKNASLTEALEQQTATSEILRVISRSPTDVQPVFDIIGERAEHLCAAEVSVVTRVEGELIHLASLHGVADEGVETVRRAFPMGLDAETVSARAIRAGSLVHIPDVFADPEYEQKDAARAGGFRGCLAVPMVREGQMIGSIFVARAEPGLFSDTQIDLLKTFADQAVIAVENVRLFTELESRNSELRLALERQTATAELLKVIGRSTFDLQPVFETLAENAVRL